MYFANLSPHKADNDCANPVLASYLTRGTEDTASMAVEPRLFLGRGSNNREGIGRPGKRLSQRRRHTSQGRTGLWAFAFEGDTHSHVDES